MMIKLNLIPQSKKEEIKQAGHFRNIIKWEFELAGIIVIFIILLVSMNYILTIYQLSTVKSLSNDPKSASRIGEVSMHDSEIKNINTRVAEVSSILAGQLSWMNFFSSLNKDVPADVALTSLSTKGYQVTLSGKAKNRETLITLKENLEKDPCFENLNLPPNNLVVRENVDFQVYFDIKKDCLKK